MTSRPTICDCCERTVTDYVTDSEGTDVCAECVAAITATRPAGPTDKEKQDG